MATTAELKVGIPDLVTTASQAVTPKGGGEPVDKYRSRIQISTDVIKDFMTVEKVQQLLSLLTPVVAVMNDSNYRGTVDPQLVADLDAAMVPFATITEG